jgi:hypothetical protein
MHDPILDGTRRWQQFLDSADISVPPPAAFDNCLNRLSSVSLIK